MPDKQKKPMYMHIRASSLDILDEELNKAYSDGYVPDGNTQVCENDDWAYFTLRMKLRDFSKD